MTIREMAASGLGWEDIVVILKARGEFSNHANVRDYVLGEKWR